jgi:hypothetical protein
MTITHDFKEEKRDVPPYNPIGCLPKLVLGISTLAFIGLATWVIIVIIHGLS